MTPEETLPLIVGRKARCTYQCENSIMDSDTILPFFEYRGEGSKYATEICKNCNFHFIAHERKKVDGLHVHPKICDNFVPNGAHEFDVYYNGCEGWD